MKNIQTTLTELEFNQKKRQTRREIFLAEMEKVVPWARIVQLIEPYYPTAGRQGRQPMPLESMLRIYCVQQWYNFSDRQAEDALYDMESVRRFVGFCSVLDNLPDETTILHFRHLLEEHRLTTRILQELNAYLQQHGLVCSKGTMVDATIIHAPGSTKNQGKQRDPDMHQTRKGNNYYFGMKIHVGADADSGTVHTVEVTPANTADIDMLPKLLRDDDQVVFGDAGYVSQDYKRGARHLGMTWCVQDRGSSARSISNKQRKRNRKYSSVRARVEHSFRIIKCQFGYTKVRYKGLLKNALQVNMLIGLTNLFLHRKRIMSAAT